MKSHLTFMLSLIVLSSYGQSLVSYYPLDGHALDFSAWQNHGVVNGAIPFPDRYGNPTGAMYFGQGNSIDIQQLPSITNGTGPFGFGPYTIVLWANFVNSSGNNAFLCLGDDSSPTASEFNLSFITDASNMLQLNKSPGTSYSATSQTINTSSWENQWIMLAVKFNGANHMVASNFTFYRNTFTSLSANTITFNCSGCPPGYPYPLGNSMHMGWAPGGKFLNGALDDVRIYNYALTDSAIFALFTLNSTNLTESEIKSDFNIYPNPVSDNLNVMLNINNEFEYVSIYDISGRKIHNSKILNSIEQIDVTRFTSGIYTIQLIGKDMLTSQKLFTICK